MYTNEEDVFVVLGLTILVISSYVLGIETYTKQV